MQKYVFFLTFASVQAEKTPSLVLLLPFEAYVRAGRRA